MSEGIAIFAVGKPTKDPQKVHFVTNFVTHLVSKWVFFLYINNLQLNIKTKPDSLIAQGLPGFNTAKVVFC